MPQLLYRIQKQQFGPALLNGEGARLYGGRWNPPGIPLVYTSTSLELALLETLVHLDGTPLPDLPPYVQVTLFVPDGLIENIAATEFPPGWHHQPSPDQVASFLLPRLQAGSAYVGFAVPSSILPGSAARNVLLNPLHPFIEQVQIIDISPLEFDNRLQPSVIVAATPPARRAQPRKPRNYKPEK